MARSCRFVRAGSSRAAAPTLRCIALLGLLSVAPAAAEERRPSLGAPTGAQLKLGGDEGLGFGTRVQDPTALYGPTRTPVVLPGNSSISTVSVPAYFLVRTSARDQVLLEGEGDYTQFGADLSYSHQSHPQTGVWTVNLQAQRARMQVFEEGRDQRGVASFPGQVPWLYQVGGGLEYAHRLTDDLTLAGGLTYRHLTIHPGAFKGRTAPLDAQGNPYLQSPRGRDEVVGARVVGLYSTLDDLQLPTRGLKLRFGGEQTFGVGPSPVRSTRGQVNATWFVDTALPGVGRGPRTLILNLQGGTTLRDTVGYDAYTLGGVNSVRGWAAGELGTGQSFVEATVEYRFPLASLHLAGEEVQLRGTLFADYASDLGSAGQVLGTPARVLGKPGVGSGVGGGLHLQSSLGLIRLEGAFNNRGRFEAYLTVGDRY